MSTAVHSQDELVCPNHLTDSLTEELCWVDATNVFQSIVGWWKVVSDAWRMWVCHFARKRIITTFKHWQAWRFVLHSHSTSSSWELPVQLIERLNLTSWTWPKSKVGRLKRLKRHFFCNKDLHIINCTVVDKCAISVQQFPIIEQIDCQLNSGMVGKDHHHWPQGLLFAKTNLCRNLFPERDSSPKIKWPINTLHFRGSQQKKKTKKNNPWLSITRPPLTLVKKSREPMQCRRSCLLNRSKG